MISDRPGRGLKECFNCHKFVGVRSKICSNCNQVLSNSDNSDISDSDLSDPKPEEAKKLFEEKGKGRKECFNCHKFVGVRTTVCPNCNQVFEKKQEEPPPIVMALETFLNSAPKKDSKKDNLPKDKIVVYAMSGPAPIEAPKYTEEDAVLLEWARDCISKVQEKNPEIILTVSAIVSWFKLSSKNWNWMSGKRTIKDLHELFSKLEHFASAPYTDSLSRNE